MSSPGYDTSSTHPPSSPDLCEYTYEGAIQDYKSRVSRAQKCAFTNNFYSENYRKDANNESTETQSLRKQTSMEIENRLSNFEAKLSNDLERNENTIKKDLPKVDIARRRELFEKDKITVAKQQENEKIVNNLACDFGQSISIKKRLLNLESRNDSHESVNSKVDLSTEFGSVKDRLLDIEKSSNNGNIQSEKNIPIDMPIVSIKHRLSALQETVPSDVDEIRNPLSTTDTNDIPSDVRASDDQCTEINANGNNNNSQLSLSLDDNASIIENIIETNPDLQPIDADEPQPVIDEQPNRLLSTINEAIHTVEDQTENIALRDSSVSWPHLFQTHVFDNIVVDNEVMVIDDLDDTINTNPKSYMVMDITSENIVHTSHTVNTRDKELLTSAGESLCKDSVISRSNFSRQQPKDNEILNEIDVMCLRNPNDLPIESTTSNSINDNTEIVKPAEFDSPSTDLNSKNSNIDRSDLPNDSIDDQLINVNLEAISIHNESASHAKNSDLRHDSPDEQLTNVTLGVPNLATTSNHSEISASHSNNSDLLHDSVDDQSTKVNLGVPPLETTLIHNELAASHSKNSDLLHDSPDDQSFHVNLNVPKLETLLVQNEPPSPTVPKESSESKNSRIKCQIVGVLEKHKCPTEASTSRSDLTLNVAPVDNFVPSSDPLSLHSPSKSPHKSTKNIFDFIKRNLLNDPLPVTKESEVNSTFYVPLIVEETPSNTYDEIAHESMEINNLIDEELEKLD